VTKVSIIEALDADFSDFEDAVQYCVAEINCIDFIVTRNISDFKHSTIEVCTPNELLEKLNV
jgi:predicted nucleic acid-binding protein